MRRFSDRVRLTVYMERGEYQVLCGIAGGQGMVSRWAREKLLADVTVGDSADYVALNEQEVVIPPVKAKKSKKRTCIHGTEAGYHCWQCGGKAKVEKE